MRVLSIKEKTLRFLTAKNIRIGLVSLFFFWVCFSTATNMLARNLLDAYEKQRSAIIKDRAGEIVRIQPNANGYYAESSEFLPPRFKELLIKKEDRFFYYHIGINPFSIARDIAQRIFSGKLEGSSTLTQQLVKNLFLSASKNPLRKLKEWILTWYMERTLSKSRILELYLNVIEWGNGLYGIEAASQHYFGKSVSSLGRQECARLAAVIPSPRRFRADGDSRYVARRSRIILDRMVARGL
ncbi:MAG: Monofunctional biosynthetic peptidoglycan transglycosylase [Parcubacteria group bacterium GW2011_GWA2_47_10]|nr:MAG: Monofunctional biosynthetic peptidoglycan transglycosylase [Parcubacteria group bacterium GW2011_GWA2_47_10]